MEKSTRTTLIEPAPRSVEELEEALSRPTDRVIETLSRLEGDILVLGAAGKMGPTLARMSKRASDAAGTRRCVIGVSRFTNTDLQGYLESHGVQTVRCDLLGPGQLDHLPDAPNVIFMAGMKFGATGNEPLTWAMNCHLPALVCQRYCRSRIVAFSTGNVYGLTPVNGGGSVETDPPKPLGDYAISCLGRERMFQYFSQAQNTPTTIIRLNYASELRYGVLVDLAQHVWTRAAIDLTMGCFNVIWQGDANAMVINAFERVATPASVINVVGPDHLSVRTVCKRLGQLMGRTVTFRETEAEDAFLSNGKFGYRLLGEPRVHADQMIQWVADWISRDGPTLNKPTHFEARDGHF